MSHDLKTPLAGFLNGLDVINGAYQELVQTLSHTSAVEAPLTTIRSNIVDLKSISSFMLMTVNRSVLSPHFRLRPLS